MNHNKKPLQSHIEGVSLRLPNTWMFYLQAFAFALVCAGIGSIATFLWVTQNEVAHLRSQAKTLEQRTEKLVEEAEYFRIFKGLIDERFSEQEAVIRRMELLMRVPSRARGEAAERYDLFTEREQQ